MSAGRLLREDLAVLVQEVEILLHALWDRTRIGLRSTIRTFIVRIALLVVVTYFLACAAVSVLDGLRGAFATFSGSPWAGDLIAGLLAFGGVAFGLWLSGRREEQGTLDELRAKYGESAAAPLPPAVTPTTSPDRSIP